MRGCHPQPQFAHPWLAQPLFLSLCVRSRSRRVALSVCPVRAGKPRRAAGSGPTGEGCAPADWEARRAPRLQALGAGCIFRHFSEEGRRGGSVASPGAQGGRREEPGQGKGSLSASCALQERAWRVAGNVRGRAERQSDIS